MSEVIFYTNPMSRGQIVRWMLEEAGVVYEQVIVEYGEQMKSEPYVSVNPMGKVPALKHNGKVVTECAAICAYVADVFSDAGLAPTADERADYYRWLFFAAGPLDTAVTNNYMGFHPDAQQQRMAGYGHYDLVISVLDQHLGGRAYLCGDRFTAADVYMGSQVDWGLEFKTIPETDNLRAYATRMRERPAFQQARQIDRELIADSEGGSA